MSNFLLKNPQCVFIHIPKTGGTSIRKGAWGKQYDGPVFGHIPKEWDRHFKFAFVRDPMDRLMSVWRMFTEGPKGDSEWCLPDDHRPLTIQEFVDIVLDDGIIYDDRRSTFEEKIRHHAIPQTHEFNCLREADFIGRFESIQADFQLLSKRLGIKKGLPHLHYTSSQTITLPEKLEKEIYNYYQGDYVFFENELNSYRNIDVGERTPATRFLGWFLR